MEGYSNSYQNGTSARETEFQRLATNVGTNVQKILQNGEPTAGLRGAIKS